MNRMVDDESSPMRQRGSQLLDLATEDSGGFIGNIARSMNLSSGAATGLVGTIAGLVMGALRKFGRGRNLDASSLGTLLHGEAGSFGQSAKSVFAAERGREPLTQRHPAELAAPRGRPWWMLALLALGVIVIWLVARGHSPHRPTSQAPSAPSVEARRPRPTPASPMTYPAGSAEASLLASVRSTAAPSDTWIALDGVAFEKGSSTAAPTSMTQISNVGKILAAYPSARIKIRGYADAEQPDAQLAQARAESVRQMLVNQGVDASRVAVETAPAGAPQHVMIQVAR
jgi:outer membrane protein OmpA-like peptidoglycan-associated protein